MSRLAVRESAFKPVVVRNSVSRETSPQISPQPETDDDARRDAARVRLRPVATEAVTEGPLAEKEYWHPLAGPAPTD